MTQWTTLHDLGVSAGDEVRHISGTRHVIQGRGKHGEYRNTDGMVLVPHEEWRIIERRTDRGARMRDEQIAGTEARA